MAAAPPATPARRKGDVAVGDGIDGIAAASCIAVGWRVGVGIGVVGGGGGVAEGDVKCFVGVAVADDVEVDVVSSTAVPATPAVAVVIIDVLEDDDAVAVAWLACRQVVLSSNISRCGVFCKAFAVFK